MGGSAGSLGNRGKGHHCMMIRVMPASKINKNKTKDVSKWGDGGYGGEGRPVRFLGTLLDVGNVTSFWRA